MIRLELASEVGCGLERVRFTAAIVKDEDEVVEQQQGYVLLGLTLQGADVDAQG